MTKEELEKEAKESWWNDNNCSGALSTAKIYICGYLAGAEPREKRIAELETQISILLSCKNCSENKGGYICQKEYEDKCLSQKIQYIKELQEENAELKEELKAKQVVLNDFRSRVETVTDRFNRKSSQLTYAKTITQDLLNNSDEYARQRAIDFLK